MANLHVLTRRDAEFVIIAHVAIPNANNTVGVNYRTALVRSGKITPSVLPDGDGTGGTISTQEKALLATGELYEVQASVRLDNVALAQAPAYLDAQYTRIAAETIATLGAELVFFGYTRS